MNDIAPIATRHRNGNLHVDLHGLFDAALADRLTRSIAEEYNGRGNIFIHTDGLTTVHPEAREAFGLLLNHHRLPMDRLYLNGQLGFTVGPDRVKVIASARKEKKCCGRCRDCKCHDIPAHSLAPSQSSTVSAVTISPARSIP